MSSDLLMFQTTAATSQDLIDLSSQAGNFDEGASDPNVSESDSSLSGLIFMPKHNQANIYRTIMIAGLPAAITLATVLESVRGGAIFSAHLFDTVKITGFNTVRVVFIQEIGARWFRQHAQEYPLVFNGVPSKVTLVSTPTWPVKSNPYHVRCLGIQNLPRSVTPSDLRKSIGMLNHPIRMEKVNHGQFIIEFNTIHKASYTFGLLKRTYRGCKPCFILDLCALPPGTLLPAVLTTNFSTGGQAATNQDQGRQDSLDNNLNSRPDTRSYVPITVLDPTLLDTPNPEQLEVVYPALVNML